MEQLNKQVEFLEDKSSSGKLRDWSGKKKRNLSLKKRRGKELFLS